MERGLLVARLRLDFFPLPLSLVVWRSLTLSPVPVTLPYTQYTQPLIHHTLFHSTSASTLSLHTSTYPLLSPFTSVYPFLSLHLQTSVHLYHFSFSVSNELPAHVHQTWSKFISSFYPHVSINAFTQHVNKEDSSAFVLLTMIMECWMETLLWEVSLVFSGYFFTDCSELLWTWCYWSVNGDKAGRKVGAQICKPFVNYEADSHEQHICPCFHTGMLNLCDAAS